MKKILILGSTGMLGNAVTKHFESKSYDVTSTYREGAEKVAFGKKKLKYDPLIDNFDTLQNGYDYVINCIGTIKPFMAKDPIAAREINSIFPWKLANWTNKNNTKMIHITTDCVFSGKAGKYDENSLHDALDDYGKSKSLGEPVDRCMVIRTSIIGEEIHKNASLIAWAKSQKGKTIKGYTNHFWNGITTNQYAVICDKVISENLYENGLHHVHAKDDVSKYDMMQIFNKKFDLGLTIESFTANETVDRTMRSIKPLCGKLAVPTVEVMVNSL